MIEGLNTGSSIGALRLRHDAELLRKTQTSSFAQALQEKLDQNDSVKFSKHAVKRMEERGADVSDGLLENLNRAVETAREKGSKDAVIIRGTDAFIVNITNNVVVTMVPFQEMKEKIFTNIDSAVLI